MAVVFSNLGLIMLFQDIMQVMLQAYIWLIWRNQGPKVSLICIFLGVQSILVALMHHVFSRSQRAAYERVVKLLGVRRLTAGFFDVSAVGTTVGTAGRENSNALSLRQADGTGAEIDLGEDEDENAGPLDPTKLDPISAALYVSQMYEKETIAGKKAIQDAEDEEEKEESEADSNEPLNDNAGEEKTVYPKDIFIKLNKFYGVHDPSKLATIAVGDDATCDEAKLDAELKAKFGQGLDSVS